jgi:hypothetical protein
MLGAAGGVGVLLETLLWRQIGHDNARLTWRFDWNSLTLPFVLRHYPLIEAPESPLLSFRGERHVVLSLRSMSVAPLAQIACRKGFGYTNRRGLVFATKGGKVLRVKLKAAKACRRLPPGGQGSLSLNFEYGSLYPRYPQLEFPGLDLRCKYGGSDWDLSLGGPTIQLLPRRAHVTAVVSREAAKAGYDSSYTVREIKRCLKESGVRFANEALAKRLYREFLPSSVEHWIGQFEPPARPAILKLYSALRYYSNEETREQLTSLLRTLPRNIVRHAVFVGLGRHLAKSGTHLLYFVKHAYRELCSGVPSEEVMLRFQPIHSLEAAVRRGQLRADALILVDDFFGTGRQATADLSRLSVVSSQLWTRRKYYIAVTGFKRGMSTIIESFPEMKGRILTAAPVLTDGDRAFAWPSRIFSSLKELRETQRICASVGEALLRGQVRSLAQRKRQALGWDDDQALIAFGHNTPNNTLPIFWARGVYQGREWQPIYRRRE